MNGQEVFELSDAARGLQESLVQEGLAERQTNGAYNCKVDNGPEVNEKIKSGPKIKP